LPTNDYWRQKTGVPWLSVYITWQYLRDPMFSRFDTIPACDGRTDGHTMTANTRASIVSRG